MKHRILLFIAAVLAGLTVSAHADPITWNLVDVRFTDGGAANGYITYDFARHLVLDFHISATGGAVLGAFNYDPGNAAVIPSGTHSAFSSFQIFDQAEGRNFYLEVEGQVDTPATLIIDPASLERCASAACGGNSLRIASGELSGVPEPWSLALLGTGLIFFKSFIHLCARKACPAWLTKVGSQRTDLNRWNQ